MSDEARIEAAARWLFDKDMARVGVETRSAVWKDVAEGYRRVAEQLVVAIDAAGDARRLQRIGRILSTGGLSLVFDKRPRPSLGDRDTPRNREHADRVDRAAFPDLPESQRYIHREAE